MCYSLVARDLWRRSLRGNIWTRAARRPVPIGGARRDTLPATGDHFGAGVPPREEDPLQGSQSSAVQGRTKWRRFAIVALPAAVLGAVLIGGVANGAVPVTLN